MHDSDEAYESRRKIKQDVLATIRILIIVIKRSQKHIIIFSTPPANRITFPPRLSMDSSALIILEYGSLAFISEYYVMILD